MGDMGDLYLDCLYLDAVVWESAYAFPEQKGHMGLRYKPEHHKDSVGRKK